MHNNFSFTKVAKRMRRRGPETEKGWPQGCPMSGVVEDAEELANGIFPL